MVTKTATRPSPRTSHSYSHSQSHRMPPRTSTTPLLSASRASASVGQSFPPSENPSLRSPGVQTDVRAPSPNYFGLVVDPTSDPRDSAVGPKNNWSPPTSSVISFGTVSPRHVPVEANPEFELFRRQTETKSAFSLSHGNLSHFASTPGASSIRTPTRSDLPDNHPFPRSRSDGRDASVIRMEVDLDGGCGPAQRSSSDSTHATEAPMTTPFAIDIPRHESPQNMYANMHTVQRNVLSRIDDRHPRLSLPQNRADPPSPHVNLQEGAQLNRADTLPSSLEDGPVMIAPAQFSDLMGKLLPAQLLLLDLRVLPQFSQSRIENALNLCIPTTLLKRPSFTLQKLQDTFTNNDDKAKFSQWKAVKYIVVYDAQSSERKDAVSAVNTLKKFSHESFHGHCYILKGGFAAFSKNYSQWIDHRSSQDLQSSKISLSLGTSMPQVAPVAGGCMMPATKTAANPFWGNIRQNQDLIGGVGQMEIKMPEGLTPESRSILPGWLRSATADEDHGKGVAEKFLHLEVDELSRMKKALSSGVSYGTPAPDSKDVQIAGIEKGGKNRYNNIWPFEHARVRLQGRPEGACDYVNASHIKASRSNKQYIASQGPLPATFEDFWSVIWDQDVRVIVMLTAESEGGQLKCHPYWSRKEYGLLRLKTLSEKRVSLNGKKHRAAAENRDSGRRRANTGTQPSPSSASSEQPYAVVRKFTLSHTAHPFTPMREITQIHYASWPDFGVPTNPSQLLGLVELSNVMYRAASLSVPPPKANEPESDQNARPMLVHCSAGCGRTGTFCTVDSVIDMLKRQRKEIGSGIAPMEVTLSSGGDSMGERAGEVDGGWMFDPDLDLVEKTVEDFRGQRLSMVQSLRQYVLCYETVLEWISQQRFGATKYGRDRRESDADAVNTGS